MLDEERRRHALEKPSLRWHERLAATSECGSARWRDVCRGCPASGRQGERYRWALPRSARGLRTGDHAMWVAREWGGLTPGCVIRGRQSNAMWGATSDAKRWLDCARGGHKRETRSPQS
eukprot:3382153-Prymnesium_polylepis.1